MTFAFDAVRFIASVLLNGLWEAALLASAAWLALRMMPNANATTRHAILSVAFVASLVLPVLTTWLGTPHATTTTTTTTTPSQHAVMQRSVSERKIPASHVFPATVTPLQAVAPASLGPQRINVTIPRALVLALVAAWLIGMLVALVRLVASLAYLENLKRNALPVPVSYRASLQRWADAMKGGREVRLCRSHEIAIPIAVGLFDAMILVPDQFLDELEPTDVDRIVLHELAHLRRADDWMNALERLAQAALFFNPAIQWLVAQLDVEREVACDDWVLQKTEPLPYAHCLAKIVEGAAWPYRAMSAPGAFITRRAMSVRIERLLSKHRDVGTRAAIAPTGLVVAGVLALSIAVALVSPSLAYPTPAAPATPPVPARRPVAATHPVKAAPAKAPHVAATAAVVAVVQSTPAAQKQPVLPPSAPVPMPKARPAHVAAVTHVADRTGDSDVPNVPNPPGMIEPNILAADPDYIDELASVGYTGLTVDQLVQLKAVGVDANYIRSLQAAGLGHLSVSDLVRVRVMNVTPDYIREIRARFGPDVSVEAMTTAKAVGVTPGYIAGLSQAGVKNLTFEQATRLYPVGVTVQYVRDLAQAGYPNLSAGELERMRALGIDAAYIARASAHGFHNLTINQLVNLKATGILP